MAKFSNKLKSMASRVSNGTKTSNFVGIGLYTPAFIAAVAYVIMALVIILPFEFPIYDDVTGQQVIVKYNLGQRILVLLIMTIPIALSIYTINCMIGGKCFVWSYVVSIVTIVWVAIFVISAIVYTVRAMQKGQQPTAKPVKH